MNAPDSTGRTAIIRAAEIGDSTIVALLLDHGVDTRPEEVTGRGAWGPVTGAAAYGHDVVIRQLARYGASLELVDGQDWTALMHAARGGRRNAVLALLSYGAKVNVSAENQTPEKLASENGHTVIAQELRNRNNPFALLSPEVPADRVYVAADVDRPPRRTNSPQLVYPRVLREGDVEGYAIMSFVIDIDGSVDEESIRVVRATHPEFGVSAFRTIAATRFTPSTVHGRLVRVRVFRPITYKISR